MKFDKKKIQERFNSCVESFKRSIGGISARVTPGLLDSIKCEVYGSHYPISNFANVNMMDARTLSVQVFDQQAVDPIYKALQTSQLGVNPIKEGVVIRVPFAKMTEEKRNDLMNIVRKNSEDSKVAMRNIRRDVMDEIKKMEKNKEISENDRKKHESDVQKMTDDITKEIEKLVDEKVKEMSHI